MMGGGNPSQFASSNTEGSWSGSAGSIPNSSRYRGGTGSVRVCLCGHTTVVRRSKTTANPDRPFYGCPNYKTKNNEHCNYFCWVDNEATDNGIRTATEAACELGRRVATSENQEWRLNVAWKIGSLETEVRILKCCVIG